MVEAHLENISLSYVLQVEGRRFEDVTSLRTRKRGQDWDKPYDVVVLFLCAVCSHPKTQEQDQDLVD